MMQMWEDLMLKAKNAGLDVIDTYVFWNAHEPSPGNVSLFSSFIDPHSYQHCFRVKFVIHIH